MKLFKVREVYDSFGWTYVRAEDIDDARQKLEDGKGNFREDDDQWSRTLWDTLTEATERARPKS